MACYVIELYRNIGLKSLFNQFAYIDNEYINIDENTIIVDFSSCNYISPKSLIVLTSYLKNKIDTSLSLDIVVKTNSNIETYISRVDFYNILDINKVENFNRHDESGRFTTIKNINKANYDLIDEIMDILLTHECVSRELYYTIDWSFNELMDNIFEHANSVTGGFLIAQSYDDRVEFCAVDNGIGISNSLKKNEEYSNLSNLECLKRCIKKEVTSGCGQGSGLYITSRFIERNQGEMHIYSNKEHLCIKRGKHCNGKLNNKWDGTIITMKINKNIDIDIYEVFDTKNLYSLPAGYCDSEKKFVLW